MQRKLEVQGGELSPILGEKRLIMMMMIRKVTTIASKIHLSEINDTPTKINFRCYFRTNNLLYHYILWDTQSVNGMHSINTNKDTMFMVD